MSKVYRCISCHTVNGIIHNGCQCDICDGYILEEDIPKEKINDYINKYEKKHKKWTKEHTVYVKEVETNGEEV